MSAISRAADDEMMFLLFHRLASSRAPRVDSRFRAPSIKKAPPPRARANIPQRSIRRIESTQQGCANL